MNDLKLQNNKTFKVCTMEFQIQGVSNDWLLLKEEDRGVEFLRNLTDDA